MRPIYRQKGFPVNKQRAMRIHATLLAEANRLKPEPNRGHRRITYKEALKVVTEKQMDYIQEAQIVFNGIIIERRTRSGEVFWL